MSPRRWFWAGIRGKVRADFHPDSRLHDRIKPTAARGRIAPAGLMFLAITSVGWGFNWPITKYLLSELPPLTPSRRHRRDRRLPPGGAGAGARPEPAGSAQTVATADAGGAAQRHRLDGADGAGAALAAGQRGRLIAYTMPVWAALLAWPVLGERPTWLRTLALLMAFAGLAAHHGRQRPHGQRRQTAGDLDGADRRDRFCAGTVLAEETADAPAADPGRRLADRARLFSGRDRGPRCSRPRIWTRCRRSAGRCWSIRR